MSSRARTALRQRPAHVSYREPSSDESAYASDDDRDSRDSNNHYLDRRRTRNQTRRRPRPDDSEPPHEPSPKRLRPATRSKPSPAKKSRPPQRRRIASRPSTASPAKRPLAPVLHPPVHIPSDGRIPNWSSLPFEILSSIFDYASYPLRDDDLFALPSIVWLIRAATVCKNYTEPALSVLYMAPPLVDLGEPHRLLALLRLNPASWHTNYAAKVKRLHLDARRTLAYSVPSVGLISVPELISHMPQLSDIDITDPPLDRPPFRKMTNTKWWTYPPEMFPALDEREAALKSWRWHAHMIRQSSTALVTTEEMFLSVHLRPSFKDLNKLSFSHFSLDQTNNKKSLTLDAIAPDQNSAVSAEGSLGRLLAPLANLRSLDLVSCQAELWLPVLSSLPTNLEHLSISNSAFLIAEDVRVFLASHGRQLRSLTLDHNQALSLQFLTELRTSCPRLEKLHMDLRYYSPVSLYRDSDPLFDALLTADDLPRWPRSLESIELVHLRQWDSDAAELFFTSLLNAAGDLPFLRTLVIKAILNINWRDRAGFRSKWIGRLHRVFMDRSPPPDKALASFRSFRLSKGIFIRDADAKTVPAQPDDNSAQRLESPSHDQSQDAHSPDAEMTGQSSRRSRRIKQHEEHQEAAAQAAAELSRQLAGGPRTPGSLASDYADDWIPPHMQGRCNKVDISIDNLRPSEVQFNEADFLDEEASGDEDWNGDTREEGTSYAW